MSNSTAIISGRGPEMSIDRVRHERMYNHVASHVASHVARHVHQHLYRHTHRHVCRRMYGHVYGHVDGHADMCKATCVPSTCVQARARDTCMDMGVDVCI